MGINTLVGGKWTASVYTLAAVEVSATIQLTVDGAVESQAADLAASPGMVVAAGSTLTGAGEARGVLWTSPDGAQFAPGELLPTPINEALGVALRGDDVPVVVGRSNEPRPTQLLVARRDGGGWSNTVLVPDATGYSVNGVAAIGQTIVVTGSYDRGLAGPAGVIWVSSDGGATFQQLTSGLEEYVAMGAPVIMNGVFVLMAEGRINAPLKILTSGDGVGWSSVGLALTASDPSIDVSPEYGGAMAVYGDKLLLSVTGSLAEIAVFGLDGHGTITDGFSRDDVTIYRDSLPFVAAGAPYVVSRSVGGFVLARVDPDLTVGHQEVVGPVAAGATLARLSTGVAASSTVYPVIEPKADGGFRWGPSSKWSIQSANGWIASDAVSIPADPYELVTNGKLDLLLSNTGTDPADDKISGPAGGTFATVRSSTETSWPPVQLIATGPGGDYLKDAVGFQDGFLAVGSVRVQSEAGDLTITPLIAQYTGGNWAFAPAPAGAPTQTRLSEVYASGDGDVLAVGGSETEGSSGDLLFTRDGAGAWSLVPSPFTGQTVDIVDVQATPTALVLLVQQDANWFQYLFDAGAFTSSPITFDGSDKVVPDALVEVGGSKYLIGTASGNLAPHLAVWKLEGEQAVTVEWSDRVTSIDLDVADVLVQDTHILVAGTSRARNLVWDLTINTV